MQVNRLFQMIYILMEKGNVTAKELAERFEVSVRTIYRDVDILSGANIPIYSSRGKGGGIQLLPDFILNKSLLSEADQNEILFALQSLSSTKAIDNNELLSQLSGLFKRESIDWIEVDFSPWGNMGEEREKFQMLKSAILQNRIILFTYFNSFGERSQRSVEPMKMKFKNSSWYLQAFCREKQAFRLFKICRIEEIEVTKETFARKKEPPKIPEQWVSDAEFVPLELWFSEEIAFRVYDEFDRSFIERKEDGGFLVRVSIPEDTWLYGYLLSFGKHLKVLSPQRIQENMKKRALEISELYL